MNRDFLENITINLNQECIDIEPIQVTTIDGVAIASILPDNIIIDKFASQSSSMIMLAESLSKITGLGELKILSTVTNNNLMAFKSTDNDFLLAVKSSQPFVTNIENKSVNRAAELINKF